MRDYQPDLLTSLGIWTYQEANESRRERESQSHRDYYTESFFYCQVFSLFTFQMLSPFLVFPLKIPYPLPYPAPQPTHSHSQSWHSLILGHRTFTGPRVSPSIDEQLGHPLLHIQLEPHVPPCVVFDSSFSSKELWGYWLVHIDVLPMGLQTPSAP